MANDSSNRPGRVCVLDVADEMARKVLADTGYELVFGGTVVAITRNGGTRLGNGLEYNGRATTVDDVARVRAFGRGWLFIESYVLTPPRSAEWAAFESLKFSACITWPAE